MGRRLGDADDPLLVSVRSGAKFSMPGMMETVLDIGLGDASVEGLARQTGNQRFAWDSYRRLVQMYGRTVLDLDGDRFEDAIDAAKAAKGVTADVDLDADDLRAPRRDVHCAIVEEETGRPFPQDPREQLQGAVLAVFDSWNSDRAVLYRRRERIPTDLGTAVNVQAMVFGNRGATSGSGVAFTRDPSTGATGVYGDYLPGRPGRGRRRRHPQHPRRWPTSSASTRRATDAAARAHGAASRATTATCATSSSPSSRGTSGCSRPGSASAPPRPRSASRSTCVDEGVHHRGGGPAARHR